MGWRRSYRGGIGIGRRLEYCSEASRKHSASFPVSQERRNFLETSGVDGALHRAPGALHRSHRVDTGIVPVDHLVPQRPSGAQPLLPADAMKPEEHVLGYGITIREPGPHRWRVLADGALPFAGYRSDACRVRAMIVTAVQSGRPPFPRAPTVLVVLAMLVHPERFHVSTAASRDATYRPYPTPPRIVVSFIGSLVGDACRSRAGPG